MRYLDDLLLQYPRAGVPVRKFILGQLLTAEPEQSAEEVVELLWRETADDDPSIRRQARYVMGRYLVRTGEERPGSVSNRTAVEAGRTAAGEVPQLLRAAGHQLEEPLDAVQGLLAGGTPPVRIAASLVLGRLWTPRIVETLSSALVARGRVSYPAAFALAEIGNSAARSALLAAAESVGRQNPDIFGLLRHVPSPEVLSLLEKQSRDADAAVGGPLAIALAAFPPAEGRESLARIVGQRLGWPTIHALGTMGSWADPSIFPLVGMLAREKEKLVVVEAVRAAATMRCEEAIELCREMLDSPSTTVQSAAIEALVRLGVGIDELVPRVSGLLDTRNTRLRVQAILVVAQQDPERTSGALADLLIARSSLSRRGAAYVLGHLRGDQSLDLLEQMARHDPNPAVQCQAIRSLARFEADEAVPALLRIVAGVKAVAPVIETLRSLAHLPSDAAGEALEGLSATKPRLRGAAGLGLVLRCAGSLAGAAGVDLPPSFSEGLEAPESPVKIGALEGLVKLGDRIPVDQVRMLWNHEDPSVRWRSVLASLVAGDAGARDPLLALLRGASEPDQMAGLKALLEYGFQLPVLVTDPRNARLTAALRDHFAAAGSQAVLGPEMRLTPRYIDLPSPRTGGGAVDPLEESVLQVRRTGALPAQDVAPLLASYKRRLPGVRRATLVFERGWLGAVREMFRWPRVLYLLPFVVLFVVALAAVRTPPPTEQGIVLGPRNLEPGTFAAVEIEGVSTRTGPDGTPSILRSGTVIRAGDSLETEAGGTVTMADAAGNSIRLGAQSAFRLEDARTAAGAGTEARFTFDGLKGRCLLDFRRSPETKVQLGRSVFIFSRGSAEVSEEDGGRKVAVISGEGTLFTPGGAMHRLYAGRSILDTER